MRGLSLGLGLGSNAAPAAAGGGLGSELVTNGDFAGGSTGWTVSNISGGTSITGGALVFNDATDDGDECAQSAMALVAGHTYRVAYTITARTGGTLLARLGGTNGTQRSTTGTFTEDLVAGTTSPLNFVSVSLARMTVDNVSVKEVLP